MQLYPSYIYQTKIKKKVKKKFKGKRKGKGKERNKFCRWTFPRGIIEDEEHRTQWNSFLLF